MLQPRQGSHQQLSCANAALQQQLTVARGPTTFSNRLTGEVHDTLRLREGPIEAVISPTGRIGRI